MLPTKKTEKVYDFRKMNCLLYGPPKIGKTTFASTINNGDGILFLATEKGHNSVEVFKVDIPNWNAFRKLVSELKTKEHEFKYLVIDIADWFYKHCEKYICEKHHVEHPNDLAYGKGSALVKDEFVRAINALNHMGFGLCFLSHCGEKEFKTKTKSWTSMTTSLAKSPSGVIEGLCDFIFFAYLDEADGERKMRTKGHSYINCGDRTGLLPPVMPFKYSEIQKYLKPKKVESETKPETKKEEKGNDRAKT